MTKGEKYDSDVENDENKAEDCARKRHNLNERIRRDNMKDSYCQLRDVLPCFKQKKVRATKLNILKESQNFIRNHKSLEEINEEKESLDVESRLLENLIAEIDKAAANNVEAVAQLISSHGPLKRRRYLLRSESSDEDCESSDEDCESSDEDCESSDEDREGSPPHLTPADAPPRRKAKRIRL